MVGALLLCILPTPGSAATDMPSTEQLQLLQSLPAEQQQNILRSLQTTPDTADTPSTEQLRLLQSLPAEQQQDILRSLKTAPAVKKPTPLEQPVVVKPIVAMPERTRLNLQFAENLSDAAEDLSDIDTVALKPFGYDLFAGVSTTFAPVTEIPVPVDYVIGPGDTVQIQLFGKENAEYELLIDRKGRLQFPGIGPIAVTGMRFDELKESLHQRIGRQKIGVKIHVSLGELRSMRVFVMGDVNRPGSYRVSAMSTMTNVLFVSGGVRPIGSLRNIQLKRQGRIVQHLDLYQLLLQGDTRADMRMQPGDVLFVPPVGATVGVTGEVRRPARYELRGEQTVKQVLDLAGGLLPTAYELASRLQRIDAKGERILVNLNLSNTRDIERQVQDGDVLKVHAVLDGMENTVFVLGHVQRPGGFQWFDGMKISDVLSSVKDLLPEPNLSLMLVRRERVPDRMIEVLMSRLNEVFAGSATTENLLLQSRDKLFVFGLSEQALQERTQIIETLTRELRQQAGFDRPEAIVSIDGNVYLPGDYPLTKGMHLRDLIHAAGGMLPQSDARYVLRVREQTMDGRVHIKSYDLSGGMSGNHDDSLLSPRDVLHVFPEQADRPEQLASVLSRIKNQATANAPAVVVNVTGRVRSPGQYPLEEGMTVRDLIRAAGGLTEAAYELEAELSRYELDDTQAWMTHHEPVQLAAVLAGDVSADIVLQSHDNLQVRPLPHWGEQRVVKISGEVRFPGSYPVRRNETLYELLIRAGGLTDQAFPQGAVFVRESLRIKEQQQLDRMATRLEADLAAVDLAKVQISDEQEQSVGMASSLLRQLKSTKAVGRLVIDLPALLAGDIDEDTEYTEDNDVLLRNGDKLFVPVLTQEVTILGEVQHVTSHLYRENLSVQEYIGLSGGMTYLADADRVYIVRANGAVLPSERDGWFAGEAAVYPGDTIVVPLDAERMKPLTLWTNISQIVYQLGIAAASWNAVGLF
jgi:polysaccharide export outer membrane protein